MSTEFKFKPGDKVRRICGDNGTDGHKEGDVDTVTSVDDGFIVCELNSVKGLAIFYDLVAAAQSERVVGDYLFKGTSWPLTDPKTGGRKGMRITRFDLLPPEALAEIATVVGKSAEKYPDMPDGKMNWELGMPYSWHLRAALTHIEKFRSGQDFDEEDNLHHLAHAATLLMFLLTYSARGIGTDDRPIARR